MKAFWGWGPKTPRTGAWGPAGFTPAGRELRSRLESPGVHDEGAALAVDQHQIQHVQRIDRANAFDQRAFAVPIERLQREATGKHFAALAHELLDLPVEVLRAGERFVTELRKAALHAQSHTRPVQQDRCLEALPL